MVAWALSCSVNWALVLWIRKEKIKKHSTKSSTRGLISNLHVLFEVKTIALVSHSSALVWTRLSFVFTRLYSPLICLWLVCTCFSFVFTRLYSSALVSHSSALILPLVCNISNNLQQVFSAYSVINNYLQECFQIERT